MELEHKLEKVIEQIALVAPDVSFIAIRIFVNLARLEAEGQNSPGVVELAKHFSIANSTMVRNIQLLSSSSYDRRTPDRSKRPGLDLVWTKIDPQDNRRMVVGLTIKGKNLIASLEKHLGV